MKNGEVEQQADIVGRVDQGLVILIDGRIDIALADQKLRGGVMRGGVLGDGERGAGARLGVGVRQIGEIDGVVVNGKVDDIFVAADGCDDRRRSDRRSRRRCSPRGYSEKLSRSMWSTMVLGIENCPAGVWYVTWRAVFDDVGGQRCACRSSIRWCPPPGRRKWRGLGIPRPLLKDFAMRTPRF